MPWRWHTPIPWLLTLAAFCFTWVGAVGLRRAWAWNRRRRNPSIGRLTADGGTHATATVRHYGEPTTYTVEGRIVDIIDGSANPFPQPFHGRFLKGSGSYPSLTLGDQEWGLVRLGHVRLNEYHGNTWLEIDLGTSGGVTVPDSGAVVEVTLKANPPLRSGDVIRRFAVRVSPKHHRQVLVEDRTK
jgi:hypothetical protein